MGGSMRLWCVLILAGLAGCDGWFGGVDDCDELYVDNDGDGFGDEQLEVCEPGLRYAQQGGDCDDSDPSVFPGQLEMCNGRVDDCTGSTPDFFCDVAVLAQCGGVLGVYTVDGETLWTESVPGGLGATPRGATRLPDGRYAVLTGIDQPVLQVFDRAVPEWTAHTVEGWQLDTDPTDGQIGAWGSTVYAPANAGPTQGVVAIDVDAGTGEFFETTSAAQAPLSVVVQADQVFTVRRDSVIESYPLTSEQIGLWMPVINWGVQSIAVTEDESIYAIDASDDVLEFRPQVARFTTSATAARSLVAHDLWGVMVSDQSNTIWRFEDSLSDESSFEIPADGPCFVSWDM